MSSFLLQVLLEQQVQTVKQVPQVDLAIRDPQVQVATQERQVVQDLRVLLVLQATLDLKV